MSKNLVIVESPAKAKTIEGYLGKDFIVRSSYGHIRDLPKNNISININENFEPNYEIVEDKKKLVAELKKIAKEAETIWLATDDDREGEAISWHLKEALGLTDAKTKRIVFREITKPAILKAIQNPRSIDIDLVNSQQARRILDRIVGYELSPVLWKKIKMGLSAGRVQSVAVRLIVEREQEIRDFLTQSSFKVTAHFVLEKGKTLHAELNERFENETTTTQFLEKCKGATFSIKSLQTKPSKRTPAAPFTTSTLQQEAARKLGFSVSQTMTLAQRLYESGKITYMRTDSTNLSETAIAAAKEQITAEYGEKYVQLRNYKTKSETAQEAHEAIRPTDFALHEAGSDRNEKRLYELIWKRAIASQMADAQLEKTTAEIAISTVPQLLVATGEVVKFDGFLAVYVESTDDEDEENSKMLPPLKVNQVLDLDWLKGTERFSKHPPRYSEASLVKKLEEMGIGRPSTYAPTISTIIQREYVVKDSLEGTPRNYQEITLQKDTISVATKTEITGAEKQKLFPTNIGIVVNNFLVQHFQNIVDFHFTADIEKELDEVASGKNDWHLMIKRFYQDFHPAIAATQDEAERVSINQSRELGIQPVTGLTVYAKTGRYGPYIQIGENEDVTGKKPQFASLKKGQRLETITLEEALELFKLPRTVGTFEEKEMVAAIGKFGPYIRHDGQFYSLEKTDDPISITPERAIELIRNKREKDRKKLIKSFAENEDVKVLNGRYGAYISVGKQNVKIPKGTVPETLTLEQCLELAKEQGVIATSAAPTKKEKASKGRKK
jgi:DNA topoisomerase-1